jgi:hypothetical protein
VSFEPEQLLGGWDARADLVARIVAFLARNHVLSLATHGREGCVYRKHKPGRNSDEARQGSGVNL